MTLRRSKHAAIALVALSALGSFSGCEQPTHILPGPHPGESDPPPDEFIDDLPQGPVCTEMPACNPAIEVDPNGPALVITDPEVLAKVPLEKVVGQILWFSGSALEPRELMQRLFDTMNDTAGASFSGGAFHCDDPGHPALVFENGAGFTCPRAEGALAASEGFFQAGHPDSFIPVAIVNRFDLTSVSGTNCGQARIVYAKQSGLTDPNNRVFLIFEAALGNPSLGCLEACRPVAEFWKGLEGKTTPEIATAIDDFFFDGMDGFTAAVNPSHYGMFSDGGGGYGHESGQVRVSMGMQAPWEMRELVLGKSPTDGEIVFTPTTVKNNPAPAFFGAGSSDWASQQLKNEILSVSLPFLAAGDLPALGMFIPNAVNAVESALSGESINDYHAAATGDAAFLQQLDDAIAANGYGQGCPPDDPLDAEAILRRATALSCAGCHAPNDLLGPTRSLGCGVTWPDSIGQAHVTETGELSPALKDVFLPHRAQVMATFLQACDLDAILGSLASDGPAGLKKEIAAGRTLGGSRTH
jgi:hypothetical protein